MKASLSAIFCTCGCRYQHGWPRRVCESSMKSSATSSQACSHSTIQPSTANLTSISLVSGLPEDLKISRPHSTTISPRFILPPHTLYSSILRTHSASAPGSSYPLPSSPHISSMSIAFTRWNEPFGSDRS